MNAEHMPSEMPSYIVRQTENVNENQKQNKSIRCYIWAAWILVLVLTVVCGWYGIARKAAAFEKESEVQAAGADMQQSAAAELESEEQGGFVAGSEEQEGLLAKAESEETVPEAEEKTEFYIPSGDDLLSYIAKQNVTAEYEESLSGLLWNYELIADIQSRVEAAEKEAERFREEEYRELLVTMGIAEDHVSQDPVLPDYLTKTYNPLMDIELSEDELSNLLRLVEAEAPSEDIYGKILVANVVLNRVNNEKMANTVNGVIYEKIGGSAQFSPTAISWYWNSVQVTDSTREAVARCLSGEDYSNGALYFYAWERNPNKHKTTAWMQELECLFTHGGHRFFR